MKLTSKTWLLDNGVTVTVKFDGDGRVTDVEWPPGDKKLSLDWMLRMAELVRQENPGLKVCVDHGAYVDPSCRCRHCDKAAKIENKPSPRQPLTEAGVEDFLAQLDPDLPRLPAMNQIRNILGDLAPTPHEMSLDGGILTVRPKTTLPDGWLFDVQVLHTDALKAAGVRKIVVIRREEVDL